LEKLLFFLKCLFCWGYKPTGKIEKGDCIVTLSFGRHKRNSGSSNIAISQLIDQSNSGKNTVPVIAQFEVAEQVMHGVVMHRVGQWRDGYLPSWKVVDKIIAKMRELGVSRPILYAHPDHVWRIKRHFLRHQIELIIPDNLSEVPYDRYSVQWWTRGPIRWRLREILVRLYCWRKNLI